MPSVQKREPFTIREAVDISTSVIQRTGAPDFRSEVDLSQDMEDFLIEGNLTAFVDLLQMAFENIIKHAGMPALPIAKVSARRERGGLIVRIENDIAPHVATQIAREQVAATAVAIKNQPFSTSVRTEGKSGFPKMQKILHHDFALAKRKPILDFGFIDTRAFFVEVRVPLIERQEDAGK